MEVLLSAPGLKSGEGGGDSLAHRGRHPKGFPRPAGVFRKLFCFLIILEKCKLRPIYSPTEPFSLPLVAKCLQTDLNYFRIIYGVTDTDFNCFGINYGVTDTDLAILIP